MEVGPHVHGAATERPRQSRSAHCHGVLVAEPVPACVLLLKQEGSFRQPLCDTCTTVQVDDFDVPVSSEDELDDLDLGSSGNDGEGIDEDSAIFGSAGVY